MVKEAVQEAVDAVTPLVAKLAETLKVPAEAVWQALVAEAQIRGYASLAGIVVLSVFSLIAAVVALTFLHLYYSCRLQERKRIEAANLLWAKDAQNYLKDPYQMSDDFGLLPYGVVAIIAAAAFVVSLIGCCARAAGEASTILTGILAPEAGAVRAILSAVTK